MFVGVEWYLSMLHLLMVVVLLARWVMELILLVVDDDGLLHFGEIVATDHCLLAPILVSFEEKLCVLPAVKIWLT